MEIIYKKKLWHWYIYSIKNRRRTGSYKTKKNDDKNWQKS